MSASPAPTTTDTSTAPSEDGDVLGLLGLPMSDSRVDAWAQRCGLRPGQLGNIMCNDYGFELDMDASMTVTSIVLYANEGGGGFSQYAGALPAGLAFTDNYPAVVSKLGPPAELVGGSGASEVSVRYSAPPYELSITFNTWHQTPEQLAAATVHSIAISLAQ